MKGILIDSIPDEWTWLDELEAVAAENNDGPFGQAGNFHSSNHPKPGYQVARFKRFGTVQTLTKAEWNRILDVFDWACAYCKHEWQLEQDHMFPISKGGDHSSENVVPACRDCNRKKKDRLLIEFLGNRYDEICEYIRSRQAML